MQIFASSADILDVLPLIGTVCQMCTAMIAVAVGVVTFRYTKRQSALTLVNHNNGLANAVNSMVVASPEARSVLGKLQDPIVGSPDDAVLFMYLNYVHNTYRMRQIGAVTPQIWQDTLGACASTLRGLRREQIERLLARGYEAQFQKEVLRQVDREALVPITQNLRPMRPVALRAA